MFKMGDFPYGAHSDRREPLWGRAPTMPPYNNTQFHSTCTRAKFLIE